VDAPWRQEALGGSDAPAIVGVDPFRSAGDVWAEKTGRLTGERAERAGDVRAIGRALESVLLGVVAERLNRPVTPQLYYRHPTAPLAATVDGLVLDGEPTLVECKTAGLLAPLPEYARAYGDDRSDEVPDSVRIQVHHQLAVLDAQPDLPRIERVLVPALIGGRGLRVYELRRDAGLLADLVETECAWWADYVVGNVCPPTDPPSLRTLRAWIRRDETPAVALEDAVVETWLKRKADLKQATSDEEMARRLLLACLGDAEAGACAAGRVTYRLVERRGYTVAPTRSRTLRWHPETRDTEPARHMVRLRGAA
jgi:putative phage-type endonuclease